MSSSATLQAEANALNAKLEGAAAQILDEIDRQYIRKPIARQSFVCATKCYDQAASNATSESIQRCVQGCQIPFQQANALVQQEVSQFQNRLNRNMTECQEKARDMVSGNKNVAAAEQALLKCMSQTVDEHIRLLKPMKERIVSSLKSVSKK